MRSSSYAFPRRRRIAEQDASRDRVGFGALPLTSSIAISRVLSDASVNVGRRTADGGLRRIEQKHASMVAFWLVCRLRAAGNSDDSVRQTRRKRVPSHNGQCHNASPPQRIHRMRAASAISNLEKKTLQPLGET